MPSTLRIILLLIVGLLPASAHAVEEPQPPRVLILGDHVYNEISRAASTQLRDRAQVVYASVPRGVVHNSITVIEHLDQLLGDDGWDVIHFNCGLGDLVYRAPRMESFRLMPIHVGGVRATSAEHYEANLRKLVGRLSQTEAVLVWASTTPIRHSSTNVFQLESEIEYNAIAARVMTEQGVRVNDMYTYVLGQIDMDRPASHGADPFFFDRQPIHRQVVNAVLDALGLPPDPIEPTADASGG